MLEGRVLLSGDPSIARFSILESPPQAAAAIVQVDAVSDPETPVVEVRSITPAATWTVNSAETKGGTRLGLTTASTAHPPAPSHAPQKLPDLAKAEVIGSVTSDEDIELYQVPVHPETRSIRVDLSIPATADPTSVERLWLLDGSGEVLGRWPLPEPGMGVSVVLNPTGIPGADLFVGISRDSADAGAIAPPAPFVLSIGRDDGPAPQSPPITGRPEGVTVDLGLSWLIPAPESGATMAASWPSVATVDPSIDLGPGQDASIPLPLVLAGPSAGLVSDGNAMRPIGPLDGSVIDLTLVDVPFDEATTADPEPDETEGLGTIGPPGGFPVLASSRPAPPDLDAGSVALLASTPRGVEDPSCSVPSREGRPAPSRATEAPTPRRSRLGIAMGFAAGAGFALLLPDLIAALTPPPPARPLPWRRRGGGDRA